MGKVRLSHHLSSAARCGGGPFLPREEYILSLDRMQWARLSSAASQTQALRYNLQRSANREARSHERNRVGDDDSPLALVQDRLPSPDLHN